MRTEQLVNNVLPGDKLSEAAAFLAFKHSGRGDITTIRPMMPHTQSGQVDDAVVMLDRQRLHDGEESVRNPIVTAQLQMSEEDAQGVYRELASEYAMGRIRRVEGVASNLRRVAKFTVLATVAFAFASHIHKNSNSTYAE